MKSVRRVVVPLLAGLLALSTAAALPLAFFADGPNGKNAAKLKLNAGVKYTVILYKNKKVTANFALNEIDDETASKIGEAADKIAP